MKRSTQIVLSLTCLTNGGGVHACLGAQLAMMVTKVFASHLLLLCDWKLTGEAKFVQFPLKKIRDDYQIKITRRM
ncbi:MAG: cytochrome P450 [Scytonema sp. PMC 1069.18]|nr:cytochrome P450 [Scytonema sp. PMC 1069.18]MEC4885446.1 cytochrome P450 [Scytonema sp. PMC 1070.18]